MSLSDCPECGEALCECGHEYEFWSTERLRKMRDLLSSLVVRREGGEARRLREWEKPRCAARRNVDYAQCVLREGHSRSHVYTGR